MTAMLWFGTILYVHLILKPAYTARGLPWSELILGWGSILVMAVTGILLSVARVPTWEALFHTRFGLLLIAKIILFLIMVSTAAFVTLVIGPKLRKKRGITLATHKQNLTLEELSQFYGREGRPTSPIEETFTTSRGASFGREGFISKNTLPGRTSPKP